MFKNRLSFLWQEKNFLPIPLMSIGTKIIATEITGPVKLPSKISTINNEDLPPEEHHHLFDFLTTDKYEDVLIEAFGGLLPEAQGEDYNEQDFANRMKKKRNRQRCKK